MKTLLFTGAVFVGVVAGLWSPLWGDASSTTGSVTISGCRATDGDTIRCGNERIRLNGIDAPEMPGHCRTGRDCAPGDPFASAASLRRAMTGTLRIDRLKQDRYGRTIALVSGSQGDLSCWQLKSGYAVYVERWDEQRRLRASCGPHVR
jgi:endonuclease YncB( thermonuclease family)